MNSPYEGVSVGGLEWLQARQEPFFSPHGAGVARAVGRKKDFWGDNVSTNPSLHKVSYKDVQIRVKSHERPYGFVALRVDCVDSSRGGRLGHGHVALGVAQRRQREQQRDDHHQHAADGVDQCYLACPGDR